MTTFTDTIAETIEVAQTEEWRTRTTILNAADSTVLYEGFGQSYPSPYVDADAAYDAWCAAAGVGNTGSDHEFYTGSTVGYYYTEIMDIGFCPFTFGSCQYVLFSHGMGLAMWRDAVITSTDPTDLASQTSAIINVGNVYSRSRYTTPRVAMMLGGHVTDAVNNMVLKGTPKVRNPPNELIGIWTSDRDNGSTVYCPVRTAFRITPGNLEMVITPLYDVYTSPFGNGSQVDLVLGNEDLTTWTDGIVLNQDPTANVPLYYVTDDMYNGGELTPNLWESPTITTDIETSTQTTYGIVQTDTGITVDTARTAWGLTVTSGSVVTPGLDYDFRAGAVVAELLRMAEVLGGPTRYRITAAETPTVREALLAAFPALAADTMTLTAATTIAIGALVAERLTPSDVAAPRLSYRQTLAQALTINDSLRNFLGADLSESISIAPTTTRLLRGNDVLSETMTITHVLENRLLMRATLADGISITDADLVQQFLTATVSEGIEIVAGYMLPGSDTFTTWAVNTSTGATTEYTNYPFNSFTDMGHKYIAASEDGLFELNGDDDAGTDIIARIKSGWMQFGGSKFSSFKGAYIGLRGDGAFVLQITTGDGNTYNYSVTAESMKTTKVQMGKGLRARYFSFELISTGQDFDLDSIEFIPLVAKRRV